MPTSTSLVTNLPADFNTFGQGVDTSLQYLLGGTTGQVLSKTSGTNMAFTWVTPTDQTPLTTKGDLFTFTTVDARLGVGTNGQILSANSATATGLEWIANDQGDITAVTAGTGLSGGGTSGAVTLAIDSTVATLTGTQTLTNKTLTSPALTTPTISTLTTNGDTIYGTGSGAISRLGIGSTGQVLTVASGVPSWATPASGSTFAGCSMYGANPTIATSTISVVLWPTENYDSDGYHSTSSNTSRITIPSGKAGKYLLSSQVTWEGTNANFQTRFYVYKNGSSIKLIQGKYVQDNENAQNFSYAVDAAVADYFEIYVWQNYGSNRVIYNDSTYGWFQASYLGA